jgi:hypothetical protein
MEMFNTHRRDILNFDNYMDLKKPGFGGPASAVAQRDGNGNKINKNPKLAGHTRVVERDPAFSHPVYDPTYKAMTGDLVYKQEKKKAFTYDHSVTGIPVVEVGEANEGLAVNSFSKFINESEEDDLSQLEADLRRYEEEGEDSFVDDDMNDEFGANPLSGENPFNEEPTEDIKKWLNGLKSDQGANPMEDEDYGGEEYDEPLYGPDDEEIDY